MLISSGTFFNVKVSHHFLAHRESIKCSNTSELNPTLLVYLKILPQTEYQLRNSIQCEKWTIPESYTTKSQIGIKL